MKIIIVYASAGGGHFKAAQAVYQDLKQRRPEWDIELLDVLAKTDRIFAFLYHRGYSILIARLIWIWQFIFWITDTKVLRRFARWIARFFNAYHCKKFAAYLIQEKPDYVISTHFLPPEIAVSLKKKGLIQSKIITVITDFGAHSFWISEGTDLYCVASAETTRELLGKGVPADIIRETGIPIGKEFLRSYNRQEVAARLGVRPRAFTVLLMTGSFGVGPLERIAATLCNDFQVLIVCARNKELYDIMHAKKYPNVSVFGFVDNAHELMAVSDVLVSKAGGLSVSESLAMDLVPFFVMVIPGQEEGNVAALARHGIGHRFTDIAQLRSALLDLKMHPEHVAAIKDNIRLVQKPKVLDDIYHVIC